MITYAIVFILGMSFSDGTVDEALVEFSGAPHYYTNINECNKSIDEYGIEAIVNEFMSQLQVNDQLIPYPKTMPFCTEYDLNRDQYPDYPQFNKPENKPSERMINDELGREVSRSS